LIISNCIGLLCGTVIPATAPLFWHRPASIRWPLMIVQLLLLNGIGCYLALTLIGWLYGRAAPFWELYRGAALITVVVGLSGAVQESYRRGVERANLALKDKQVENERALKLASEARLSSIESRIQPHFLFNALNSVSSLIREDPARAEELVVRLSSLLRMSLDTQQESLIPLERELQLVRSYLEIQRARFEQRLRYRIEADAVDAAAVLVPPFSIQTLVENSVKFAVAPRREGGEVIVAVSAGEAVGGGPLIVRVTDDGPGFDAGAMTPGHGLDNLRARLLTLFGPAGAVLDVRGSTVTFHVPQGVHARLSG
jgi:LytS/YehU family sensor histidine kinase